MKYEIDCGKNKCHSSIKEIKSGDVTELLFEVAFDEPTSPERITVIWREPVWETYSYWGPNLGTLRHLAPEWGLRISSSRLASGAPVHSIISANDKNNLTIAVSDADTPIDIGTGTMEHTAETMCKVTFFTSLL
ncbi:MAG: hypothetical protein IKN38_05650, partial [Clostridia bacterium]|nr:hypothetical protein [Clostridia bacterium]